MARVQYSHPQRGHNITKPMAPPTNPTKMVNWLRRAKKVIPEMPDCISPSDPWFIAQEIVNETVIILKLMDRETQEVCAVIFDRKYNNITGR